ncbi:MAG: M28 family metallopeptidase [Planctomycetota bacterium]
MIHYPTDRHRAAAAALLPVLLLPAAAAQNPAALVEDRITESSLAGPIRFLSSDELEGRGVGTRGDLLARRYIASQFEQFGLEPAGPDGGWEQRVPILGILSKVVQTLAATGDKGVASFTAPEEFTAVAGSPQKGARWRDAELVFVGYGIAAPEQNWDDYKGADVRGKVLLFLNNDPSGDPDLFAGRTRLYYGRWSYKYEEAARRGAIGAIVIHTKESAGYPWQVVQQNHGRENFWLPFEPGEPTIGIRSWCTQGAAKRICALAGRDLDELSASAEKRDFEPVPLGVRVSLEIENELRELESANVLGKITGSDPRLRDEVVVATAHFDHLGRAALAKNGDDICNGALDNATGCSALINLAMAVKALPRPPRRTLLFLAVTAEESGLLGSLWYSRNPTYPKRRIVADFNIDGLSIWGETRDLEFVGYGKSTLTDLARTVAERRGKRIEPDGNPDLGLFYRSDHFSFARIGVPSAYFKSGKDFLDRPEERRRMKASYTALHYHQVTDEMAPWWNLRGAAEDVKLILECMLRVANSDRAPSWTAGDEFEKLR